MTALTPAQDPIDLPPGATIRRPDPARPFVAMSNRKRWSVCALSAVLPQLKTPSGPKAEEGTAAHVAAEYALQLQFGVSPKGPTPEVVPPPGLEDFDYSPAGVVAWANMVHDHALTYARRAANLVSDPACRGPTELLVEHKLEDVVIRGVRVYTVADVLLWNSHASRLVVGDYKFGRSPVGVGTVADPNEQCAGAAVLWTRKRITRGLRAPVQFGLFVFQPRTLFGEPWQVLAPMDRDWLHAQEAKLDAELAAVARAAEELAAGRLVDAAPGDHCKYCPSARWCPAAAEFGTAALDVDAGRRTVADLSPEEVMALWAQRGAFEEFVKDLRERVRILYEHRHPAVQVRTRAGNRTWADPAQVVEALMLADRFDLLQPPALARAEGALAPATLEALTARAPPVVTYVATSGAQPRTASGALAKYLAGGG